MNYRIQLSQEKKLIGKKLIMSFSSYKISELWKAFMSDRAKITNSVSGDLISMAIYSQDFFKNIDPLKEFEKWAMAEVSDFESIPAGMETFLLESGLYAVFNYKGSGNDQRIYDHIFKIWLPDSGYLLDDRPHFEVLGSKYKNNDINSEEEIWIPVRQK